MPPQEFKGLEKRLETTKPSSTSPTKSSALEKTLAQTQNPSRVGDFTGRQTSVSLKRVAALLDPHNKQDVLLKRVFAKADYDHSEDLSSAELVLLLRQVLSESEANAREMKATTRRQCGYVFAACLGMCFFVMLLTYVVVHGAKEISVNRDGELSNIDTQAVLKTAESTHLFSLDSTMTDDTFKELRFLEAGIPAAADLPGQYIHLTVFGTGRLANKASRCGTVVVIYTHVGEITLDGDDMYFEESTLKLFSRAGFPTNAFQTSNYGRRRRLVSSAVAIKGAFNAIMKFKQGRCTKFASYINGYTGLRDGPLPTVPTGDFHLNFTEYIECDTSNNDTKLWCNQNPGVMSHPDGDFPDKLFFFAKRNIDSSGQDLSSSSELSWSPEPKLTVESRTLNGVTYNWEQGTTRSFNCKNQTGLPAYVPDFEERGEYHGANFYVRGKRARKFSLFVKETEEQPGIIVHIWDRVADNQVLRMQMETDPNSTFYERKFQFRGTPLPYTTGEGLVKFNDFDEFINLQEGQRSCEEADSTSPCHWQKPDFSQCTHWESASQAAGDPAVVAYPPIVVDPLQYRQQQAKDAWLDRRRRHLRSDDAKIQEQSRRLQGPGCWLDGSTRKAKGKDYAILEFGACYEDGQHTVSLQPGRLVKDFVWPSKAAGISVSGGGDITWPPPRGNVCLNVGCQVIGIEVASGSLCIGFGAGDNNCGMTVDISGQIQIGDGWFFAAGVRFKFETAVAGSCMNSFKVDVFGKLFGMGVEVTVFEKYWGGNAASQDSLPEQTNFQSCAGENGHCICGTEKDPGFVRFGWGHKWASPWKLAKYGGGGHGAILCHRMWFNNQDPWGGQFKECQCDKPVSNGCKYGDVKIVDGVPQIFEQNRWIRLCGHYFWDNDEGARTTCRMLGYDGGSVRRANTGCDTVGMHQLLQFGTNHLCRKGDGWRLGKCGKDQPLIRCTHGGNERQVTGDCRNGKGGVRIRCWNKRAPVKQCDGTEPTGHL